MQCLITGVAGFIGSTLAERLVSQGHFVTGIDCFTDYYARELKEANLTTLLDSKNFTLIKSDICAYDNLATLVRSVDVIFHQAAQAGVRASWGKTFESYTHHNILATQMLLEACRGASNIKKIVYASSSSVYGDAEQFPTKEDSIPKPVSPYGVTKLAAENLMYLFQRECSIPTVSLRYFTVYGPRQRPDMGFNRFIRMALRGDELTLYGDGSQSRDFTYVDDIVTANIQAATDGIPGQVYNICGGTQATITEILSIVESYTSKLKIKRSERQSGDAKHTSADTSRAKKDLLFSPSIELRDGIKKEVLWMEEILSSSLASIMPK